ncbi:hypothetical protein [Halobacillus salinus]|uniref:hypothetical protein n=1 Tax=Halobacillus salinus TaxID=192814 RepID=UPI001590CC09|nr:hypothetical protein [Halobacillus salinus]
MKDLYKQLMFPKEPHAPKWTMSQIDEMDVHFFYSLFEEETSSPSEDVYLADVW